MNDNLTKIQNDEVKQEIKTPIENRRDFIVFVSSKNGNPNGDPDNGNAPRIDTATQKGIITDVSLKQRTRQGVKYVCGEKIMIDRENESIKNAVSKVIPKEADENDISSILCENYWDVRAFGGVFGKSSKAVTGPVQIGIGTSIDKISVNEMSINRCITNDKKPDKNGDMNTNSQFGDKPYQTYGLYQFFGSVSPFYAKKTGFSEEDLKKLFIGLNNAYTFWTSAQKGETETVKIIVFKHNSKFGNAKVNELAKCICVKLRDGVTVPIDYADYEISVDQSAIPEGVTVEII